MTKYTADIRIEITVEFEDNGEDSLEDQAINAAVEHDITPFDADMEIVGGVKEVT